LRPISSFRFNLIKSQKKEEIELPDWLVSSFTEMLAFGKRGLCYGNFDFVHDLTSSVRSQVVPNKSAIVAGDSIELLNLKRESCHTALYLGEGFYISQCLHQGLRVSTLEEMMAAFRMPFLKVIKNKCS
jgi:hypothetical protein